MGVSVSLSLCMEIVATVDCVLGCMSTEKKKERCPLFGAESTVQNNHRNEVVGQVMVKGRMRREEKKEGAEKTKRDQTGQQEKR